LKWAQEALGRFYEEVTMRQIMSLLTLALVLLLSACNFPLLATEESTSIPAPVSTEVVETAFPTPRPSLQPPHEKTEIPSAEPELPRGPAEVIAILEPGPGSRLTSPLRVAGMADSTFEQTLVVRLVLDDGMVLTMVPTTIRADLGQRGPYEVEVPFEIIGEQNALIQVYDVSARDGGIIHLNSVGVMLMEGGEAEIREVAPKPEAIIIDQPALGEMISGGVVHVEGIGIASFEGTLVVEVYDAEGNKVGEQPLIVSAPEMGQPGPFSVDVSYEVQAEGPGRIVVIDPLPVFDGIGHISSVEVILSP
jgi:hypothetical protein